MTARPLLRLAVVDRFALQSNITLSPTVGVIPFFLNNPFVDCKQNPVANRTRVYSSIMPILALLAVSSITAVNSGYVFLIVLFSLTLLIKVIAILWLIIKLIEKGVIWSKD